MDANESIRLFGEFFEQHYRAELFEQSRKGAGFLVVDFNLLSSFNPELADLTLDQPEECFKAASLAIEQFELPGTKKFVARFLNLPPSSRLLIRNIRSKDLGKLIWTEGVVRNKTEVRPQVTTARFECPSCGNALTVLQLDNKFKEPSRCSCGRKGKFKLLSKDLVDAQKIVTEEIPEQLDGGDQPKRMDVFIQNDLVSPLTERRTNPGARVIVTGIIKEVPIILRSGIQSTRFDLFIEANMLKPIEEDFTDITISPEEEKQILELSQDKQILRKMVASVAPSIYGHDKIKEALVLQMAGGVRKVRQDGVVTRGDCHIMLVGDPGAAKSQLLKRMTIVAPKARYVGGKGASGAGLSATVVKDEFLQGWSLEAGALVLANRGLLCIDELDKMSKEDTWAMHEALEQQTVTISKANIQATLRCETTVLAAANPKNGRFDAYETIAKQIDLPPTLINRFDLIFPIKDIPEASRDEKMATFILSAHQSGIQKPAIDSQLFRKYVAYARQKFSPVLTDAAVEEIKEYYVKMRASGAKEGAIKTVPLNARQLEGLIRLSEAHARIHLRDKVKREDAKKAVELLDYCLRQVALDEETGTIDIDRIATGTPASQRNKIIQIKEVLLELENKVGKSIPLEDVMQAAQERGISSEEAEDLLQKLKRQGDLFEPKRGFVSRI